MTSELLSLAPLLLFWFFSISSSVFDALIKESRRFTFGYSLVGMAMVVIAALCVPIFGHNGTAFNDMIRVGGTTVYFDVLFALGGILTVVTARPYLQKMNYELDEFYTLVMYALGGMLLMAHSNHMVVVFIGIEIMSICFYVLAGYIRTSSLSVEAALKYFLLGAFASGFLVYGMALIYGATGSMEYGAVASVVSQGSDFPTLLLVGIGLIVVGLSFKVAAFPFHSWVPDVYQGAPSVVTGFMSTAGKAAAFAAFLPLMMVLMPGPGQERVQTLLAVIAAASMLYGNISALRQNNVKRMLAYSSIAHAGYIMIGIVTGTDAGESAMMFYLGAYLFMQLGAFVIIGILENREGGFVSMNDYAGLAKHQPTLAALMAVFLFSLTGIPPLAGFFAKYYLFYAAVEAGFTWLTIVGVASSIISVYFYLGLVVQMYFREPADGFVAPQVKTGMAGITLLVTTVAVFLLGLYPVMVQSVTEVLAMLK